MSDIELHAMTTVLLSQAVEQRAQVEHGDGLLYDPNTDERKAVRAELERRGCYQDSSKLPT